MFAPDSEIITGKSICAINIFGKWALIGPMAKSFGSVRDIND